MAIHIRKSGDRGCFRYDWLKTYHTFSFGDFDEPTFRGFHALKVLNENFIRPGTGYPVQSHHDMEIFSIVITGGISHQDDLGNGSILRAGDVQLMSAGKGIVHSTYNASDKEEAHFLQIWMTPNERQLQPSYQEKFFSPDFQKNKLGLIISSDGREGSLLIHQDANVYMASLDQGQKLNFSLDSNHKGWIQIIKGELEVNGVLLETGDGASVSEIQQLEFTALLKTNFLLIDLNQ